MGKPAQNDEQQFLDFLKKTSKEIFADQSTPPQRCPPSKTADYLLRASTITRGIEKGICYFASTEILNFSNSPEATLASPKKDGIFLPLNLQQRIAVKNVLTQLANIGIPISPCKNNFQEFDGFRKFVFYAFHEITNQNDAHPFGQTAPYDFAMKQDPSTVRLADLIGIQITENNSRYELTILHEIMHALGSTHFPPNFAAFPRRCLPEFYPKKEMIKAAMQANKCAVNYSPDYVTSDDVMSVMFCKAMNAPQNFTIPAGDKIALQKIYKKLLKTKPALLRTATDSKTPKGELLINSTEDDLIPGYYPSPGLIAYQYALESLKISALQNASSFASKKLKNNYVSQETLNQILFHSFYFMYEYHNINKNNPEQDMATTAWQAFEQTASLFLIKFALAKTNVAACTDTAIACASYGIVECIKNRDLITPLQTATIFVASSAAGIGSSYVIQKTDCL